MNRFKLASKLYNHQRKGIDQALARPTAFAHMAETGTGKTAMILAEYQQRLSPEDIMDLLVIAPAGSITNWYLDKADDQPSELKRHLDPALLEDLVIASNRKNRKVQIEARQKLLREKNKPRALFVNIESLSLGRDSDAEILCQEFLKAGKCMMVIDESTTIRHHKSNRCKAVLRLGRLAKSRRIMTGLITPRSPLDLFAQFNFLDQGILGHRLFSTFRARYAQMHFICKAPNSIVDLRLKQLCNKHRLPLPTGLSTIQKVRFVYERGGWIENTAPIIDDYKNLEELRGKIAPWSFQILKSECLDLEPKIYLPRDVPLTEDQKRIYKQIREESIAELANGHTVTANLVLTKIMRLHQVVCGHIRAENGDILDIPSRRIESVLEVLEEHTGKAVIWVTYDHELRKLAQALATEYSPEAVACFWGGNYSTRGAQEKAFLSDPVCRFMISTPGSGGRGNTWTVANLVIYAANSYDLEHRYQSEDRTHRIGQKLSVTYVDLIARGTVEERIIRALRRKIDLTRAITGETYRDWLI